MQNLTAKTTVLWSRVAGLAALHGAITVTWLIYNLYLPQLLAQFGFSLALAQTILVVENLLAVGIEPAMGALSDQTAHRWNSRFPLIFGGVITATVAFILIPVLALVGSPVGPTRWLLPLLLIAWALAMATFRSPSLFLLKKCAVKQKLPQAAAIFAIIAGFFAAIRPFVTDFILALGPLAAFAIGSGGLLLGAVVLRQLIPPGAESGPDGDPAAEAAPPPSLKPYLPALALIFGAGLGGAWSLRFSTAAVSKLLTLQFSGTDVTWLMSFFFFMMMGIALPLGIVAANIGNHKTMLIGVGAAALGLAMIGVWPNIFLLISVMVLVLVGLSVVTTGAVPFALSVMPAHWGGLGIGMYFSGFTFAAGWFHALFGPIIGGVSARPAAFLGAASFLISWLCISASLNVIPHQKSKVSPQVALFAAGAILAIILLLGWAALSGGPTQTLFFG